VIAQSEHPRQPAASTRPRAWLVGLILVGAVLLGHGGSLHDGLFFDDYWHRATLRSYGWSFHDLVESATFDLPGRLAHLWWQEVPLQWRYARPVAMLAMKLELIASRGNPVGVHAFALGWHLLATWMVYLIALWALRSRGWALLAAVLFAIQPHSVFAVSWIAARNALVSGALFFAAVVAYLHASPMRRASGRSLSVPWLILSLVLWVLALFARETAVIFPLVIVVLDWAAMRSASHASGAEPEHSGEANAECRMPSAEAAAPTGAGPSATFPGRGDGGRRSPGAFPRGAPWVVYTLVALLTVAYLYWRLVVFPTSRPPEIYFTAPHGLVYVPWALGKLLHMVFALVFHTPMFLGLATYGSSLSAHVLVFGIMGLLVGGIGAWYVWASRGLASRAVWPIWLLAAFVPVIPVFVMPHFGYLPAAALVVMLVVMVRALRGRWRSFAAIVVVASSLWSLTIYRYAWRGIVRNEQVVYADIEDNTPRPPRGSRLFFINLPVAGIYASVALREAWGLDDLEGYVLTFAPQPLMMDRPSMVRRVGPRTLVVSTPPPGYFSGLSGRMLIDGMRPGKPLRAGLVIRGKLFDTTILEADARGVTRLAFTFKQPLDDPSYYFYVSTPKRPACRLVFGEWDGVPGSRPVAARRPLPAVEDWRRMVDSARTVAAMRADPAQAWLDSLDTDKPTNAELNRLEDWRRRVRADALYAQWVRWRQERRDLLRERAYYFRIIRFFGRFVKSDLFLTGSENPRCVPAGATAAAAWIRTPPRSCRHVGPSPSTVARRATARRETRGRSPARGGVVPGTRTDARTPPGCPP